MVDLHANLILINFLRSLVSDHYLTVTGSSTASVRMKFARDDFVNALAVFYTDFAEIAHRKRV